MPKRNPDFPSRSSPWGILSPEDGVNLVNLDLTALEKAVASLGKALRRAADAPSDEEVRDAVIQRFEYTYELCWKMVKRRIEADSPVPSQIDSLSFSALMREAAERGLIRDVTSWFEYREQRNVTTHTYDSEKARGVFETAKGFLPDAESLLAELRSRNRD
jgi:nucleotidyltransferase substrate binding protein (TIGR01987 family)